MQRPIPNAPLVFCELLAVIFGEVTIDQVVL